MSVKLGFGVSNAQDKPSVSLFLLIADLDGELSSYVSSSVPACLQATVLLL